jgi:hypothetical protein
VVQLADLIMEKPDGHAIVMEAVTSYGLARCEGHESKMINLVTRSALERPEFAP